MNLKVGDRVRIKKWNEIVSEFGRGCIGSGAYGALLRFPGCEYNFTSSMEEASGAVANIVNVYPDGSFLTDFVFSNGYGYRFTEEMVNKLFREINK